MSFRSRADLDHPPLARGGGPRSGGGVVANEFNRRHVSRLINVKIEFKLNFIPVELAEATAYYPTTILADGPPPLARGG